MSRCTLASPAWALSATRLRLAAALVQARDLSLRSVATVRLRALAAVGWNDGARIANRASAGAHALSLDSLSATGATDSGGGLRHLSYSRHLTSSLWLKPGDSHCFPFGLGGSRFTDPAGPEGEGLTWPPRATAACPAAVSPIAFGSRATDAITMCALNVLPTRLPGGTPRTFSCEGAALEYRTSVLPAMV